MKKKYDKFGNEVKEKKKNHIDIELIKDKIDGEIIGIRIYF